MFSRFDSSSRLVPSRPSTWDESPCCSSATPAMPCVSRYERIAPSASATSAASVARCRRRNSMRCSAPPRSSSMRRRTNACATAFGMSRTSCESGPEYEIIRTLASLFVGCTEIALLNCSAMPIRGSRATIILSCNRPSPESVMVPPSSFSAPVSGNTPRTESSGSTRTSRPARTFEIRYWTDGASVAKRACVMSVLRTTRGGRITYRRRPSESTTSAASVRLVMTSAATARELWFSFAKYIMALCGEPVRGGSTIRTVAAAPYCGTMRRAATTAAATASPTHTTMIHALRATVCHARRRSIS